MTLSSTTIDGKFKADVQGTALYMPPEFLRNPEGYRTRKSLDVWAYGILLCFTFGRPEEMRFHILQATELARDGELIRRVEGWVKNISDERQRTLARACLLEDYRLRPSMLHVLLFQSGRIDDLFSPINPTALLDHAISLSLRTPRTGEYYDEVNFLNFASDPTFGFGSEVEGVEDIEAKLLFEELIFILEEYEFQSTYNRTDAAACSNAKPKTEMEVTVSEPIAISVDVAVENKTKLQADEREIDSQHRTGMQCELLKDKHETEPMPPKLDPQILFRVGHCFEQGLAVERSTEQAEIWYDRAIQVGHVKAQTALAKLIERGGGDDARALELVTRAGEAGSRDAHWQLGDIYEHGTRLGVAKYVTTAQEWYRRASEGEDGLPRAKFRLAKLLLMEQGAISSTNTSNPAVAKAKKLLNDAAAAGDHEAQFRLAQVYGKGET